MNKNLLLMLSLMAMSSVVICMEDEEGLTELMPHDVAAEEGLGPVTPLPEDVLYSEGVDGAAGAESFEDFSQDGEWPLPAVPGDDADEMEVEE